MAADILRQALRYNRWANLQLLDVCAALDDEQLQLSSPGTYGTIADTLQHLLAAEQRYLHRLVGFEVQLSEKEAFAGMPRLKSEADRSGQGLIDALGRFDPEATTHRRDEWAVKNWVVMTQAIHHGNDHRTHICSILGQNRISYGDLDVWAFGESNDGYAKC